MQTTFSAESYFATQPPPPTLQQDVEKVREFIARQAKEGRNVVLVTVSANFRLTYAVIYDFAEWRHNGALRAQRVSALQL
jgi:hypothetical protein